MQKAVAALAIALATQLGSCGHDTKMARYRDARDGWTISYPASMRKSVVDHSAFMVSQRGVVIADFQGVNTRNWLGFRPFPADGVAFALMQFGGARPPDTSPPEARFPLSQSSFKLSKYADKPSPKPLERWIVANGSPFEVLVWFGPRASTKKREEIWKIVRSLRFPPQRTGTMSGGFYVLEDASRYPLGSVVRFEPTTFPAEHSYAPPFYLVHAPGGLYAIGWTPEFEPKCKMKLDRPHLQFYCAATRGRWDRLGRPIVRLKSAYRRYNNVLDLGQAKIGRDGQVLVGNWTNAGSAKNTMYPTYEHRFWP